MTTWSFAHKDGVGVISEVTGDHQHRFTVVTPLLSVAHKWAPSLGSINKLSGLEGEVSEQAMQEPCSGKEITIEEARRWMRADALDDWHSIHQASCEHFADTYDKAKADISEDDVCEAIDDCHRWDQIGLAELDSHEVEILEQYRGDGQYALSFVVDGVEPVRLEFHHDKQYLCERTVRGKFRLLNDIKQRITARWADLIIEALPAYWQCTEQITWAPLAANANQCCGAPMAYDSYRREYRCTKCGFDPYDEVAS